MITLCCILSAHKASQFAGRQLGGSKILLVVGGHMLSGTWLVCNCLLQAYMALRCVVLCLFSGFLLLLLFSGFLLLLCTFSRFLILLFFWIYPTATGWPKKTIHSVLQLKSVVGCRGPILLFHGWFGTRISSPIQLATLHISFQNLKWLKNAKTSARTQ